MAIKIVRIPLILTKRKLHRRSAVNLTNRTTTKNEWTKNKRSIFQIYLAPQKTGGSCTVFEEIACQTPRCRNVIYDGVRLEISPYNLRAVTTLRVLPKERNEPKMRKQLPVQPCAPISAITRSPVTSRLECFTEENGLETFDLGISRASSMWWLFQRAWLLRSNNSRIDTENNSCERGSRETSSCISYDKTLYAMFCIWWFCTFDSSKRSAEIEYFQRKTY